MWHFLPKQFYGGKPSREEYSVLTFIYWECFLPKRVFNFLQLLIGRPSRISQKTRVVCLELFSSTSGFKPEEEWIAGARVTTFFRSPWIQGSYTFDSTTRKSDGWWPARLGKWLGCPAPKGLGHGVLDSICKWLFWYWLTVTTFKIHS